MFNNLTLHSCVSLARAKLQNTSTNGTKDDVRLCRWVLLKNALTNSTTRSVNTESSEVSQIHQPDISTGVLSDTLAGSCTEETFLFPDGDIFSESFDNDISLLGPPTFGQLQEDDRVSEAQWLDSLLESLCEDSEYSETDSLVSVEQVDQDEEDEDSELMSLLDLPSNDEIVISRESIDVSSGLVACRSRPFPTAAPVCCHRKLLREGRMPPRIDCTDRALYDSEELSSTGISEDCISDSDSESIITPYTKSTSCLSELQGNEDPKMSSIVRLGDRHMFFADLYPFDTTAY